MTATLLRTTLEERLGEVAPPPGDVERARRAGRGIRRRRRAVTGLGAAAALTACAVGVAQLTSAGPSEVQDGQGYASLGAMDFSHGARAYADPGKEIHIGGRTFSVKDLDYLDTDAAATSYGMVFYDDGRPMLLAPDGEVSPLATGPLDSPEGFRPTAKVDSTAARVALATLRDGTAKIAVQDLTSREVVAAHELDCGKCGDVVIDAFDGGVVFLRTGDGVRTWDTATGEWADFAGPDTRVADVRNGVVLYDGPKPTAAGWRLVEGAIDSQLTFDGRHVLYWSSRLEPTTPGDAPIDLEVAQPKKPGGSVHGFFTVDTDGSILVAHAKRHPDFIVYDCEVPSGACTELGPLRPTSGDPMFIGNDM